MMKVNNLQLLSEFSKFLDLKNESVPEPFLVIGKQLPPNIKRIVFSGQIGTGQTITCPPNRIWKLLRFYVDITATATIGTRAYGLKLLAENGTDVLYRDFPYSMSASQVRRFLGNSTESVTLLSYVRLSIPTLYIKAGESIKYYDIGAIDSTDSYKSTFVFEEWQQ